MKQLVLEEFMIAETGSNQSEIQVHADLIRPGGGGTPCIRMIGMIVVFFRGCNRRFSIL